MATSQNGWPANSAALTKVYTIGDGRQVRLQAGDAGWLLKDFADWFDKSIENIDAGQLDDWGYAERAIRGSSTTLSNHASGTALDLNATKHPLGKRGTFTPEQTAKIRARLKRYKGCLRWGGDYSNRADEMHFEINALPDAVHRLVAELKLPPTRVSKARELLQEALVASPNPARKAMIRAGLAALPKR